MAGSDSWVARTSAHIRLHRDFDAGDYPDARVFYCWHLVDEAFRRAKGCHHLTVEKSRLHSEPSGPWGCRVGWLHVWRNLLAFVLPDNEIPDPILRGYNLRVSGLLARFMEYCIGPSSNNSSLHCSLQGPIHRQGLSSSRLDVGADTFVFLGNFDTHGCHPLDHAAHQAHPTATGSGLIHNPFFGLLAKNGGLYSLTAEGRVLFTSLNFHLL